MSDIFSYDPTRYEGLGAYGLLFAFIVLIMVVLGYIGFGITGAIGSGLFSLFIVQELSIKLKKSTQGNKNNKTIQNNSMKSHILSNGEKLTLKQLEDEEIGLLKIMDTLNDKNSKSYLNVKKKHEEIEKKIENIKREKILK